MSLKDQLDQKDIQIEELQQELDSLRDTDFLKIYCEKLKTFPIKEEGVLSDGTYRRFIKIELPRSKRIATMAEMDFDTSIMPDDTARDSFAKAIACLIELDGKAVDKEIRDSFYKTTEEEVQPIADAFVWFQKEKLYPEYFGE